RTGVLAEPSGTGGPTESSACKTTAAGRKRDRTAGDHVCDVVGALGVGRWIQNFGTSPACGAGFDFRRAGTGSSGPDRDFHAERDWVVGGRTDNRGPDGKAVGRRTAFRRIGSKSADDPPAQPVSRPPIGQGTVLAISGRYQGADSIRIRDIPSRCRGAKSVS